MHIANDIKIKAAVFMIIAYIFIFAAGNFIKKI